MDRSRLLLPEGASINFGATSPDADCLAGYSGIGLKQRILVWDLHGKLRFEIPLRNVRSLSLGPRGDNLYVISGQKLLSIKASTIATNWISTSHSFSGEHPCLVLSGDGRILAGQLGASRIGLFDAATGALIARLEHPFPSPIQSFSFSTDNGWFAVACSDAVAQIWNLRELRNDLASLKLDWPHPAILPAEPQPFHPLFTDESDGSTRDETFFQMTE